MDNNSFAARTLRFSQRQCKCHGIEDKRPRDGREIMPPGTVIHDKYELIRELGRGGTTAVYLARNIRLGRLVALKFVTDQRSVASKNFLARAQNTARCIHQNVVTVLDVDYFERGPVMLFMVLEYLEGKTLRQLMAERTRGIDAEGRGLSPGRALELMLPVLRALEYAHSLGIVHCDLKLESVMLTDSGVVKVLDFGSTRSVTSTSGGLLDAVSHMAPEQISGKSVDHRADIWAVGLMLFELIAGRHPMAPLSLASLEHIANLAMLMPRLGDLRPDVGALGPIIDRCLRRDRAQRTASVAELILELEPHLPGCEGVSLTEDDSPFVGLDTFHERDAHRFFGRDDDIQTVVSRVREQPLVALVGPSGAGKSSLVRAGVIPMLKRSGEGWQSFTVQPGRAPMLALGDIVAVLAGQSPGSSLDSPGTHGRTALAHKCADQLRASPGHLGAAMREHARREGCRVLLFIDQFEELYSECLDADERWAFLFCLSGIADHPSSPLRVVLSMRTDTLERVVEDRMLMKLVTRGLMMLPPMHRSELRAALVNPLGAAGYLFESRGVVHEILDALEGESEALPRLQVAATALWAERDCTRRRLTEASYRAMGGIAGILAGRNDLAN